MRKISKFRAGACAQGGVAANGGGEAALSGANPTMETGGVAASGGGEAALSGANPTIEMAKHGHRPGCSVSVMPHPDVALERARLRFAQESLEQMRRRTAARVADENVLAANEAD